MKLLKQIHIPVMVAWIFLYIGIMTLFLSGDNAETNLPQNSNSNNANYLLFGFAVIAAGAIGYLFKRLEQKNKEMTDYIKLSADKFSDVVIGNTKVIEDLKDTISSSIMKSTRGK